MHWVLNTKKTLKYEGKQSCVQIWRAGKYPKCFCCCSFRTRSEANYSYCKTRKSVHLWWNWQKRLSSVALWSTKTQNKKTFQYQPELSNSASKKWDARKRGGLKEATALGGTLDESVDVDDIPCCWLLCWGYYDVTVREELRGLKPIPETTAVFWGAKDWHQQVFFHWQGMVRSS